MRQGASILKQDMLSTWNESLLMAPSSDSMMALPIDPRHGASMSGSGLAYSRLLVPPLNLEPDIRTLSILILCVGSAAPIDPLHVEC